MRTCDVRPEPSIESLFNYTGCFDLPAGTSGLHGLQKWSSADTELVHAKIKNHNFDLFILFLFHFSSK